MPSSDPSFSYRSPIVSAAIVVVAAILLGGALDLGQNIFAPVVSAIVLGVVLAPLVDRLTRLGIPPAASAMAVLVSFIGLAGAIFFAIEPAISRAVARAPLLWYELENFIDGLQGAMSGLREMEENVNQALDQASGGDGNGESGGGEDGDGNDDDTPVEIPSIMDALSYGPSLIGAMLIFAGTLYFFLAGRADLYRQAEKMMPLSAETLCAAESQVSRYFLTITCINAGFGILVTIAMIVVGMPSPALWGIATFLLNFVLYLGPFMVATALLVVGIVTFEGILSFVPMGIFIGLNMLEAQFVTPSLVGRQMSLHPLFVFLSLVFWLWLWGPLGGLVAIPLLVWIRVVTGLDDDAEADHVALSAEDV